MADRKGPSEEAVAEAIEILRVELESEEMADLLAEWEELDADLERQRDAETNVGGGL